MTFHYDLDAIRSHANGVSGQSTTMSETSTTMSATGPGPKEMYGILVSQVAHPVLSHVSDGGENMLQGLAEFLDSLEESLAQAVAAYEQTEQDNVERSHEIAAQLDATTQGK